MPLGRRNRRQGARWRWLGRLARLAGVAVVVAGGAVLWPPVRDTVRTYPYFTVRQVIVRGGHHLRPDVVRRLSGIAPGGSIWDVDTARAERRLQRRPWIRSARVRRVLPGRVIVRIREERPVAILAVAGRLYHVADGGEIFGTVARGDTRNLPYVTGVRAVDLEDERGTGLRALRSALTLLHAAAPLGQVSEIHVDRDRGLVLLPVSPRFPIEIGWSDFERKLERLAIVMARWSGRADEIARVTLTFDDEVVVHPRRPRGA